MQNEAVVYSKERKLFVYNNMTFGEWLRNNLNTKGISNAELARRSDVSPTYIGNLLRDYSPNMNSRRAPRPSEDVVANIAKALDVPLSEARLAAGYASVTADGSFAAGANVRVSLLNAKDFTEEDRDEFSRAFEIAYEMAKKRIEEKKANSGN